MAISKKLKTKLISRWKLVEPELLEKIKRMKLTTRWMRFSVVLDGAVIDYVVFDDIKKKFTHLAISMAKTGIIPVGQNSAFCDTVKTVKIRL